MAFNRKGYLDAGLHEMAIDQIEEDFVTQFPHSSTRKAIIEGYKKHSSELKDVVKEYVQFIDGSFVTNKNDPGDIDLVCFMDGDMLDALPPAEQHKLMQLLSGPATKAGYMCDAYYCISYPDTHPKFPATRSQRKYWMGEFGFDRSDVPKGIVVLRETPPPPTATVAAMPAPAVGS